MQHLYIIYLLIIDLIYGFIRFVCIELFRKINFTNSIPNSIAIIEICSYRNVRWMMLEIKCILSRIIYNYYLYTILYTYGLHFLFAKFFLFSKYSNVMKWRDLLHSKCSTFTHQYQYQSTNFRCKLPKWLFLNLIKFHLTINKFLFCHTIK